MTKLVIFDMDGLMFDTETLSYKMWCFLFNKYNLPIKHDFLLELRGLNLDACVKLFKENYQDSTLDFKALKKEKNELVYKYIISNGVPVKDGLFELLDYLKKKNIKIGLATSSSKDVAQDYLKFAKVDTYFDYLVFGDEVSKSKPDPEIFLKVSNKAKIEPFDALVLEDSKAGVEAAISGKFNVFWIPDGVYFETKALKLSNLKEVIEKI